MPAHPVSPDTTRTRARCRRHIAAALLAATTLATQPAPASGAELEICRRAKALGYDESKEGVKFSSKRILCAMRFWQLFQPKPLDQILNPAKLARYHQAIAQDDCRRALNLLSDNFRAAHPDAPPHLSGEYKEISWQSRMSTQFYTSLGLCQDLQSIGRALKDAADAGITFRPFWSRRENFYARLKRYPPAVEMVYSAVGALIHELSRTRSAKVSLALLRLSDDGRAVKLHPHYETYIAFRLRIRGVKDALIDRIIARPLDPARRADIADRAQRAALGDLAMFAK